MRRTLSGPSFGRQVEQSLTSPAADETLGPEQATLRRDRLLVVLSEPEEWDGRPEVDRIDGTDLAPWW